jgi:hypothetical protein
MIAVYRQREGCGTSRACAAHQRTAGILWEYAMLTGYCPFLVAVLGDHNGQPLP